MNRHAPHNAPAQDAKSDQTVQASGHNTAPTGSLTSIQIRRRAPITQKPAPSQPPPSTVEAETEAAAELIAAPDTTPQATGPQESSVPESAALNVRLDTADNAPADGPGDGTQEPEPKTALGSWARRLARASMRPPARPGPAQARSAPAAAAEPRGPDPRGIEGLVAYWTGLRNGRGFPNASDLDEKRIAAEWPNCILMRCRSGSKVLEPEMIFSGPSESGLGRTAEETTGAVTLSPMMLQWLVSLAGEALRNKSPVEDTEAFPSARESVRYRAVALPLNEDERRNNHVLCHVRLAK